MPTTLLHGETWEQARARRHVEEAPRCPVCGSTRMHFDAVELDNHCTHHTTYCPECKHRTSMYEFN